MKTVFISILLITGIVSFAIAQSTELDSNEVSEKKPDNKSQKDKTMIYWKEQKSGERQTLVKVDSSGQVMILAAQPYESDFMKHHFPDSLLKIHGKVDANTFMKNQKEVSAMKNRSISLLVTKEALYRLAEAYFNGAIDSSAYRTLYSEVLLQAIDLVAEETSLEEAKAETIVAETEKLKIELQKAQLEFERLKFERNPISTPIPEKEKEVIKKEPEKE
jgi:hypothetical protein